MKTLYKISVIFTLILGLCACNDDFMDRYPLNAINDANYWQSTNDLKTYANQFYASINTLEAWKNDNYSDNQVSSAKNTFLWGDYVIPSTGGGWAKSDWLPIRRCNYFLQRYHLVKGDKPVINQYLGEILFFKSKFYFDKVVDFGDVPWLNRDLGTDSEELYGPRTPRKEVMDSICHNLDMAIQYLPETTTDGRLTKYAALAYKSRVCLFEGTYRRSHNLGDEVTMLKQAADAANEVIKSGEFGIYSTGKPAEDYHNFFILNDLKPTNEAIFYAQYEKDLLMHNNSRQFGEAGMGLSKDFAESFLCDDGLPIGVSALYKGDKIYANEFEHRDLRMKQIIYTSDQPSQIDASGNITYEACPSFTNFRPTGYRAFKFSSPFAMDNEYNTCVIDNCVFRYAEVLLNYAEAKAELGECDQSVINQTIKLLRDRVGMPNMTLPISFTDPNWPNWEVSVIPLINEIRRERRVELACEGLRFIDLKRWKAGRLVNNIKSYLGATDPATSQYRVVYPGLTRMWNDKMYLYPLPTQDLLMNPALGPQNPGWE